MTCWDYWFVANKLLDVIFLCNILWVCNVVHVSNYKSIKWGLSLFLKKVVLNLLGFWLYSCWYLEIVLLICFNEYIHGLGGHEWYGGGGMMTWVCFVEVLYEGVVFQVLLFIIIYNFQDRITSCNMLQYAVCYFHAYWSLFLLFLFLGGRGGTNWKNQLQQRTKYTEGSSRNITHLSIAFHVTTKHFVAFWRGLHPWLVIMFGTVNASDVSHDSGL